MRFTPATMPPRSEEGSRKKFLNRLKEQVLLPRLSRQPVGVLMNVDIDLVIPANHYTIRVDLLEMFDRGPLYTLRNAWRSEYFRHQRKRTRSTVWAVIKVIGYYRLFRSMSRHGFSESPANPERFPWLFCADGDCYRYDGMHRASIARHLGMTRMPVLLITPGALLALDWIPDDLRRRLSELDDPRDLDATPVIEPAPTLPDDQS